jgi:transcriptional regulator with XRE-family HTH domain
MNTEGRKSVFDFDFFEDLTGDIAAPAARGAEDIGARLRALREEKKVSLEELARLTGLEAAFLSGIEANAIQPQLGTLIKLSKALHSGFGRLVAGAAGSRPYAITRKHERRTVSRSTGRTGSRHLYLYKSLAPDVAGRHMEALLVQLVETPDAEASVHEGEEFVFVLDGTVRLEIGGERHELEPGDSAYYLSSTPHIIAAAQGKATILAVLYEG